MDKKIMFKGVMPAVFSLYDEERNVLKNSVKKMINMQLNAGVSGFYVGGNTGECTVLPVKTRKQMLETVMEANNGKGKIIAHIGAGLIDNAYELIQHANDCQVDAIASLPTSLQSYYDLNEVLDYYRIIADRSKVPVIAYITGIIKCDLLKLAEELMKIDNIIGLKMSVPDYYTFSKIKALGDNVNLLNGPDETFLCGLSMGADGGIGTTYNFMPKMACGIYNDFKNGDMKSALEKQRKLNKVIDIGLSQNISGWKAIMSFDGIDVGYTIEPRKMPNAEDLEQLKKRLETVDYFNMER